MSRIVHTDIWSAYGYAKKAGYEGTEAEFAEGLKKGAEASEHAEESASEAAESASTATTAAGNASTSASAAATSAGEAQGFANAAAGSASDAAGSASVASAKANEAGESAATAENHAEGAAASGTAAANSASAAAASASQAAQSASSSASSATDAQTAKNDAVTAKNAAQTAQTAAETAKTAAEAAQAAAEAVEASIPADYSTLSNDVTDLKSHIAANFNNTLDGSYEPIAHDYLLIRDRGINDSTGAQGVVSGAVRTSGILNDGKYVVVGNIPSKIYGYDAGVVTSGAPSLASHYIGLVTDSYITNRVLKISDAIGGIIIVFEADETITDEELRSNVNFFSSYAEIITKAENVIEGTGNLVNSNTKQTTINGVAITANGNAITLSGTSTASGGRTTPITDSFSLDAGTYFFQVSEKNQFVANKATFLLCGDLNNIVATGPFQKFSVDAATNVHIACNVTANRDYDYAAYLSVSNSKTHVYPYATAIDDVSRQKSKVNYLGIFDNIDCVGDSLTYSQVYESATATRRAIKPYPQELERLCGSTVTAIATPGYTALDWWTAHENDIVTKNNLCAIIYLGTNGGLTDTLDTDAPEDASSETWANTNTGSYAKIVSKYLSLSAHVILIKCYASSGDTSITNKVIDDIAGRFGCAVVEPIYFGDNTYHVNKALTYVNVIHYNDLGYVLFANELYNRIADMTYFDLINLYKTVTVNRTLNVSNFLKSGAGKTGEVEYDTTI